MAEKRPLTSYDQMFGWPAAKRALVFFAVLFVGSVVLAAVIVY